MYAPREHTNQSAHPYILGRSSVAGLKKAYAYAQADLSLFFFLFFFFCRTCGIVGNAVHHRKRENRQNHFFLESVCSKYHWNRISYPIAPTDVDNCFCKVWRFYRKQCSDDAIWSLVAC